MTLRFCARFHFDGIKSISLCRVNQPDVWRELCDGLSINSSLVKGTFSLFFFHCSIIKSIQQCCNDCEDLWVSQLNSEVVPVMKSLFGCHIKDTIRCYVGLYPTYLRSIRRQYFLLPYGVSHNRIREIIIHELSHFYCYTACGDRLTSDTLWRLSEYIVPYILKYRFGIDCQESSYAGVGSVSQKALFISWVNKEISFEKLLVSLKQNE